MKQKTQRWRMAVYDRPRDIRNNEGSLDKQLISWKADNKHLLSIINAKCNSGVIPSSKVVECLEAETTLLSMSTGLHPALDCGQSLAIITQLADLTTHWWYEN